MSERPYHEVGSLDDWPIGMALAEASEHPVGKVCRGPLGWTAVANASERGAREPNRCAGVHQHRNCVAIDHDVDGASVSNAAARTIRGKIKWLLAARFSVIGRRSIAQHHPTIRVIDRPHTSVEPVGPELALGFPS